MRCCVDLASLVGWTSNDCEFGSGDTLVSAGDSALPRKTEFELAEPSGGDSNDGVGGRPD